MKRFSVKFLSADQNLSEKNATFTFHSGKSSTLHVKILPVHSEGHSLINKAMLSIMAYEREKHITFSGHYTTLSSTVAVLPHL